MPRFVVLIHDHPVLHWDLMLENRALLRTWRLESEPGTPGPVGAEELPDHRSAYLDYEGPVSGDRGTVRRFDRGDFKVLEDSATRLVVELAGERLRGSATIERSGDAGRWTFALAHTVRARRYDTGTPVQVRLSGSVIASVEPLPTTADDTDLPFVAPGLFDLQINGYGGIWFSDRKLTPENVVAAVEPYFAHGLTRLCPTLITSSHEALAGGFAAIRRACEQYSWLDGVIAGCHLEGPFLSGEDGPRGAHPRAHIRAADWDEFEDLQANSGGRVKLVTLAPEVPHAIEFIRRAVAAGVRIAIGHTAATAEQIRAAVEAGATLSTHLGNGSHGMLRRHPNYIWEQLGEPRLAASIIADGLHLPASVVRSIVWAKSPRRTILTCDASGWAGCEPGIYENELAKVEIAADGRILVAGQRDVLAGSSRLTDDCVAYAVSCGAADLRDAIDMASLNPARYFGMNECGLRAGDSADLFLFRIDPSDGRLAVLATIVGGRVRHGKLQ